MARRIAIGMRRSNCPRVGTPSIAKQIVPRRRGDLARVELVVRIERGLDLLHARVERAEELGRVLGAQALAVLAPEHALVLARQREDLVGDLADQLLLVRVLHVERRTHVQAAGVDVAEHAVDEAAPVQRGAELARCSRPGSPAERPCLRRTASGAARPACCRAGPPTSCAWTRSPRRPPRRAPRCSPVARNAHARRRARPRRGPASSASAGFVVGEELDDVDALRRPLRIVGEVLLDRQPDRVLARQRQHRGVDGLARCRLQLHQRAGIAQGRVEAAVADVQQRGVARNRRRA